MSKTILNIKNIIKIIIGVLVIFGMLKSCAKAYTFDDFVYFINTNQEKLNQIGGTWKDASNFYKSGTGYNKAKAYFGDTDYQGFAIGNDTSYVLMALNGQTNISLYQTNQVQTSGGTYKLIRTYSFNPSYPAYSNGNGGIGGTRVILISGFPNFTYPSGVLSVNEYVPQNPFYFGHMFSQPYNYNSTTIEACELNYNYRTTFIENVVTESNEVTNITATLDDIELETTDLGSYWTLKCTNSTLLKYDKIYSLNVDITTTSNTYELSEQILFVPPGTLIESGVIIRYPSGDYSFNTENATNQIIENQDENQEDDQNFFQNLYNNLVQPSGEQIRADLESTLQELNLPSGEVDMAMAGLDIINSNPNDFIISWTPKPTHFSIKGQQLDNQLEIATDTNMINFSQMERENEDLHEAMTYARAILSFSIFILFFKDLWNTLMTTLGVSTQVYEKDQEEKNRINAVHERNEENIRNAYERQKNREWLRRNAK